MERLTNKDWHMTKLLNLDNRKVLKRLWVLENMLEDTNKVVDNKIVWIIIDDRNANKKSVISAEVIYKVRDEYRLLTCMGLQVSVTSDWVFQSEEEAKDCLKWLEEHNFRRYAIKPNYDYDDLSYFDTLRFKNLEDSIDKYERLIDTAGFNCFKLDIIDLYTNKVIEM